MLESNLQSLISTPYWLLDEKKLIDNLKIIQYIKEQSGAKVLLALKGYALWKSFNSIRPYLDGCCASGLHEAQLAAEEFQKEVHTYSPAFKKEEIEKIAIISHHLVFNSLTQFKSFAQIAKEVNPLLSLGLRVNPEYSASPKEIYNPCAPYSRLGVTIESFDITLLSLLDGLHFHALCEQDSNALEAVLVNFEEKFGHYISQMKWINFGGGHHITRKGYDVEKLIYLIKKFKKKYHVEIYLEPGEAIGWGTGLLVATVLDVVRNGIDIAILDISAEAHMPDTIIMPYRAEVYGAADTGEKPYTYRLAGNTCLAGDIMGDYSFDEPLRIGDRIIFEDQMHYTMVKATTFNGIKLPSIAIKRVDGSIEVVKEFGYKDFKNRLS
ncbi:MAG: carboxynorspermidine decarboxylase [Sulfurovum sp.]|nr:carboxynorspermidine decarboxylase [Sulfurovum sp.]MCB4746317.1 carboxynorspermidine decarboxylase [Sulfurovum sp.]MCB4748761.1 carboxynorspermidine decarboxylase [Sulfurovum sp.]MCB4750965.1 carboxynorspermidine decarboxylase [Sulfurovum sp.]MCB4752161.1 carboxynorspermidine decarboxylase [Sulfurovum sp.]